jgi:pimeloyl-ACP methyl ester carboxylesterase
MAALRHAIGRGRSWDVVHDKFAPTRHGRLQYADVGQGEPVVLVHATNLVDSLVTPLSLYEPLFEQYRIISYYRAGYRGSTLNPGIETVSIEDGSDHLVDLLDHLNIPRAHIVGYSFGGVTVWDGMLRHGDRFASSTLIEPFLPRESPAAVQANIASFMSTQPLAAQGDWDAAGRTYVAAVWGDYFPSVCDVTNPLDIWERFPDDVRVAFTYDFPAYMQWGFRPSEAAKYDANKPAMPVLSMLGLDSEAAMPGFVDTHQFIMRWLPQAERAGIPYASHSMQNSNPIAVGEALVDFLNRHPIG